MAQDPFIEFLFELMAGLPGVHAKRMFGGYGIFRDGLMFGLVANETLYLKVDEVSRPEFEKRELGPFVYESKGKAFAMSYHLAPPEALEEPEQMELWAERAYAAALREAEKKAQKGSRAMSGGAKKSRSKSKKKSGKKLAKKAAKKVAKKKKTAKKAARKTAKKKAKKKTARRIAKKSPVRKKKAASTRSNKKAGGATSRGSRLKP